MLTPGFKTSEFYVALAGIVGIVVTFVQQNCSFSPDKVIALAGVVIAYITGRSYLKARSLGLSTPVVPTQPAA